MPLPEPTEREPIHLRRVECRGFRRRDGLWDIEGRIVDTKTYDFDNQWRGRVTAGTPVHDMSVRITIDEDLVVHDAVAVTDASPHRICPEAAPAIAAIKGMRIAAGWTAEVKRRLGGTTSCTHIVELLGPVATTAFQTLALMRRARQDALPATKRPALLDTCYAYSSAREVVRDRWPAFYTGTDAAKPG